jgi:predicted ATPase
MDAFPTGDVILLGREHEGAALQRLVEAARRGNGGALVLRGERGSGKTALLEHIARNAPGCRVLRAGGVQQEMDLPFAGLHQLCASLMDGLDRLPEPRRGALATAFGMRAGAAPGGFLVSVAALVLLSGAAAQQPLLCLVDDAHWFDRASAEVLGFVGRRLGLEPVALVITATGGGRTRELHSLP